MSEETTEQKISRWLADGKTFVGVYENHDLGSWNVGHRIGMPFDLADWDKAALGTRAPDTAQVIGWRYLLVAKCRTAEEAIAALENTK